MRSLINTEKEGTWKEVVLMYVKVFSLRHSAKLKVGKGRVKYGGVEV
jgi:hypothetical protein